MISNKPKPKKLSLDELVFGALSQLQVLNYNERSIRRYQSTWNRLITFAKKNGYKKQLCEKLILEFLEYHDVHPNLPTSAYKDWRRHAEFSLKILWNYARFGYFERCKIVLDKLNIPPAMQKNLYEYKKYCEEKRYLSPGTVRECFSQISLFLDFMGKRNIKTFYQIQPKDISDFICSLSRYSQRTISGIASYLRMYLKFLVYRGYLKNDLSQSVPSITVPYQAKIPSVWDRELIVKLLDAVDRSSPRGKRDYAILLLACRLGLRLGDIREISLDNIDWEAEMISITQGKTKAPLCLPLTNEVGNALIDYIKYARPQIKYRQVFLRLTQPFTPLSTNNHFYTIVKYWRGVAGIQFRSQQHKGLHSLRHSLATYLLEDNTPFSMIADILGHASMNTTMIYAKTSVETLRQVALTIKEVNHGN
ncbi:Tyrosine recombinase XerC [Legionella santicrucis]|uniref:Tyrosine recombinase XerC n=1 Tax=Legionella santicrucis TaxID=45074 RepID=A0A0W0YTZ7_9GAMM|nr:site-specific integrase [Legionella santicrucis]KTD60348.1 Tyrosine recombinase XerC [Legionella santicrucis]